MTGGASEVGSVLGRTAPPDDRLRGSSPRVPAERPVDAVTSAATDVVPVLVVGAGPAGLAVAACLRSRGVEPLLVDRGPSLGESWRARYDRLHLHTPRVQSALPGLRIPRRYGRWVARDDMARYLVDYARHHGLTPRLGVEVRRLDRSVGAWTADTSAGPLRARQVVVATGYHAVPVVPDWPGRAGFPGTLVHAADYRSAEPYRGRDVLVVGTGNTGAEVAADLASGGASRVRLAVRTPPHVIPRQLGPLPTTLLGITQDVLPAGLVDPLNRVLVRRTVGDLTPYGLPAPRRGLVAQARATGTTPTIDAGFVDQLRAGRIEPVAAVVRFDGDEVVLADGARLAPDAVVAAAGYQSGLQPLVGHLGVLDDAGRPRARGSRCEPSTPGLRFVGMSSPLKGLLLQIALDARAVAGAVAREERARRALSTPGATSG